MWGLSFVRCRLYAVGNCGPHLLTPLFIQIDAVSRAFSIQVFTEDIESLRPCFYIPSAVLQYFFDHRTFPLFQGGVKRHGDGAGARGGCLSFWWSIDSLFNCMD